MKPKLQCEPALMRYEHPLERDLRDVEHFTKLTTVQKRFLRAYIRYGTIYHAARAAGVTRQAVFYWRHPREHEEVSLFAHAFTAAEEMRVERAEAELHRRAIEGWDEPIVYHGRVVAMKRLYSDRLLETVLRAARPEKYGNKVHIGNADKRPFVILATPTEAPDGTVEMPSTASHANGHHDDDLDDDIP